MESTGLDEEKLNDLTSRKDVVERKNEELDLEKDGLEKELKGNTMVCKNLKDEDYLSRGREKVALNRISVLGEEMRNLKTENEGLGCSEKDDSESVSSNQQEGILTETKNRIAETTGESTNRSEEIMKSDECMGEGSNQREGIQGEASLGLDKGDMNAPIDIESDSIVEISDSEDSLGSGDDSKPNNRLERPLSGQRCDEHLISCKKELPHSLTSKRKWCAETGMSEIRTEDENKRKKLYAAPFSMEMETPSLSPQSRNIEGKSGQRCDEHLISSTPKQKWGAETGKSEIKTEGEDKTNKPDERFSMELPYSNCREELPYSLTPKQNWGAETGTSEIRTEDEDKRKKVDAAQNLLVDPSSMQMQTRSSAPQSQNMRCGFSLFNESRLKLLVCVLIHLLTTDCFQSF